MYNREPRNFSYVMSTGTGRNVGPGLYDVPLEPPTKIQHSFGKMSKYKGFLFDEHRGHPAVGDYNVEKPKTYIHGCSTLRDNDPRFQYNYNDFPAPNAYDVMDQVSSFGRVKPRFGSSVKRINIRGGVPRSRVGSCRTMSIPRGSTGVGYTEVKGVDGLVKEYLTPIDCSLSPAYYNVKIIPPHSQKMYKGCHWGKMKAERKGVFSGRDGPSPAEYYISSDRKPVHVPPYPLFAPRYMDKEVKIAIRNNFPAPGDYSPNIYATNYFKTVNSIGTPLARHPFSSSSQRVFDYGIDNIPGPGTYEETRGALSLLKKKGSSKRIPFGVSEERLWTSKAESTEFLYDIPGLHDAVSRDRRKLKGGFNVCASRFPKKKIDPNRTLYAYPSSIATNVMPSSAFKSRSSMVGKLMAEDGPPPNKYYVNESFHAMHDRKSRRRGDGWRPDSRLRGNRRPRGNTVIGFEVGERRFGPTIDFNDTNIMDMHIPGPGLLNISGTLRDNGCRFSPTKRFCDEIEVSPGPADYGIAPMVADSTLTGTWNVSLGNPLLFKRPMYYKLRPEFSHLLHNQEALDEKRPIYPIGLVYLKQ